MSRPAPLSLLAEIAWRFVRGRRSRLLDGAARAALMASALGVSAMVIGMAVMSGYREDLERKLLRGAAAVMVYPLSDEGLELDAETRARFAAVEGIAGVRRVSYAQGSISPPSGAGAVEVSIRGSDTLEDPGGLGHIEWLEAAGQDRGEGAALVVGEDLAELLPRPLGGPLRLMVLGVDSGGRPRFRYRTVRAVGTFSSGLSEFDRKLVLMERAPLEALSRAEVGEALFEVLLERPRETARVAERLRETLGSDYLVTDWRELNRELFTALELQQVALFLVLGLIVAVSTFNVASSLVVLVRERMRDIGVLAALGLSARQLRRLFLLYGGGLAGLGTLAGIALGWGVSWLLTRYELIRFDPELAEIYFLSSVPLRVRPLDVLAVAGLTLLVTVLACRAPARRAGRGGPADALRYE